VDQIEVAGSIRRMKETVKDIDILTTSKHPEKVMDVFVKLPHVKRVLMHGPTKSSVITEEGIQVDLRVVEEDSFGAALQYFTGSKTAQHQAPGNGDAGGLKINEYGVFKEPGDRKVGGRRKKTCTRRSSFLTSLRSSGKTRGRSRLRLRGNSLTS
jgi:DNA polymerase (family 10)